MLFVVILVLGLLVVFHENLEWRIVAWYLGMPQPQYSVSLERDIMIPMSDGINLTADIYRPDAQGLFPVIVTRTPYDKSNPFHKYEFAGRMFASQGFVFVVQDVRGKYKSEGEYYPYIHEASDGFDTIEWAGTRSWSSGKVGTYGFSYYGSTQWLASAAGSKYLKAMVPIVTSQNVYPRWIYNGVYRINDILVWHYENALREARHGKNIDWDRAVKYLPLIEADDALGEDIPFYNDWISHPVPDAYWGKIRVDDKINRITVPALLIGGWYDYYLDLMFTDFIRMQQEGGSPEARRSQIIIGPWTHVTTSKFEDVEFGKQAGFIKQIGTILDWYRYWLKGEAVYDFSLGPVRIFMMGKNEWRTEKQWPLRRAFNVKFYLHSSGQANSVLDDGFLSPKSPCNESFDNFVYDPADPVPSIGGTSIYGSAKPGPWDQREVEKRDDVLVYTSEPLEEDLEVTGETKVVLFASSSAKDTDFTAKLVDVYPDGKAINLKAAVIRARFRESLANPVFLEKDKVYRFEIKIGAVSNVFKAGHKIRLQISSSNFPEFGRNLNTGAPIGMTSQMEKAHQRIYHDADQPSYLLVPMILSAD